jgi:hypothetical protein
MRLFLITAAALLAGCSHAQEQSDGSLPLFAQAASVCEVTSNPSGYLGKYLAIRGVYFSDPHHRYIFDDNCRGAEVTVHLSMDKNDERSERIEDSILSKKQGEISVVYHGALKGAEVIAGCGKPNCLTYTLEDARLLSWK